MQKVAIITRNLPLFSMPLYATFGSIQEARPLLQKFHGSSIEIPQKFRGSYVFNFKEIYNNLVSNPMELYKNIEYNHLSIKLKNQRFNKTPFLLL